MRHLGRRKRLLIWSLYIGYLLLAMAVFRGGAAAVLSVVLPAALGSGVAAAKLGSRDLTVWERIGDAVFPNSPIVMFLAVAGPCLAASISAFVGGAVGGLYWAMARRGGRL